MAVLLDQWGRPIDLGKLKEVQAAPSITGVRPIIGGHPAQGLTPQRLAQILRSAEHGDSTSYLELAEEMEEKDLHYLSVLGTRKRAVAQLDITVEAASDSPEHERHADLIRQILNREEIEDEIVDILDAVGKGFSATEIIWDMSERQWMPMRLEYRFPQWFEFDWVDGHTLRMRSEDGLEDLAPFKFITHVHKAKSGLPIRGGLARPVAWGYLFKNYTIKDWVAFMEIYGLPLRVGKYGPNASETDKEKLLAAVAGIGTDAAAIIPQSMLIEFVKAESSSSSATVFKDFADYIDQQVSKGVLGQTTTTDAISGGHAVSKEHNEVRRDIERSDAKQLAATLNRDLVRPVVDLNHGPQKAYPRLRIERPEQADVPKLAEALANLVPLGLRVRQSEVRRKMGLADPGDDDDLLMPAAPPPAAAARPALARASTTGDDAPADSIDALIAEALDGEGWERVMDGIVEPVKQLLAEAKSIEEFRDRLASVIGDMDPAELQDVLARSLFAARLAGEVGAPTQDE